MGNSKKLSNEAVQGLLQQYPNWQLQNGKLYRRLVFEDFIHAFGFIIQLAMLAEKANHHPEWANIYCTVDVFLTTHDVDGISEKDIELLNHIERIIQ
ncbi:MAG: 4a-hydroxytetrahydrobiopterin dehydratase [Pseudohongiellaceae bacterium]|jgi:4a-hydroxytetrahydrobiopterin dehydratase